ncbi:hypothetical protein GOBAR_DD00098 [Gossypium barbadense]|nr:hypothetical protein GOBAR_DD00098 [Gossypium barbadense]
MAGTLGKLKGPFWHAPEYRMPTEAAYNTQLNLLRVILQHSSVAYIACSNEPVCEKNASLLLGADPLASEVRRKPRRGIITDQLDRVCARVMFPDGALVLEAKQVSVMRVIDRETGRRGEAISRPYFLELTEPGKDYIDRSSVIAVAGGKFLTLGQDRNVNASNRAACPFGNRAEPLCFWRMWHAEIQQVLPGKQCLKVRVGTASPAPEQALTFLNSRSDLLRFTHLSFARTSHSSRYSKHCIGRKLRWIQINQQRSISLLSLLSRRPINFFLASLAVHPDLVPSVSRVSYKRPVSRHKMRVNVGVSDGRCCIQLPWCRDCRGRCFVVLKIHPKVGSRPSALWKVPLEHFIYLATFQLRFLKVSIWANFSERLFSRAQICVSLPSSSIEDNNTGMNVDRTAISHMQHGVQ